MATLGLVACAKTKQTSPAPAATLYASPLFRKSLLAALDRCKEVRILSAKHGLLPLGVEVAPYEQTLKSMPRPAREAWGETVGRELAAWAGPRDRLLFFSGEDYVRPLASAIEAIGCVVERPMGARSLGARLQQLRALNDEAALSSMLPRFDRLLRRLARAQGGGRLLSQASGRQSWPNRGLYFVTETVGPRQGDWITRVGTHAVSAGSRTTLWDRISTHRGPSHGGGSHRSSIFRSHVGRALMRRGDAVQIETWAVGQSAPADIRAAEADLERLVSEAIGDMRMLWLDIPDAAGPDSDRAYLERNIIGLLSRANLLGLRAPPNAIWLGHRSADWRIAATGLWNLDHLFHHPDPRFLDVLEAYVNLATKGDLRTEGPLAPADWRRSPKEAGPAQLVLFEEAAPIHGA